MLNDAGELFLAGTNFLMGSNHYTFWFNGHWFQFDITNAVRQAGVPLDKNIKVGSVLDAFCVDYDYD